MAIVQPRTVRATLKPSMVFILAAATLLGGAFRARPAPAQPPPHPSTRNLSGRVTDDSGREPLRGAIVQLQNSDTNAIVSYITQADGEYRFKRLNGSIDYRVWATFRGHRSDVRSISKFDSHMRKVIDFKIRPY